MISQFDQLHRFLFEQHAIRGELVQLRASWQSVQQAHPYPDSVASPLGQALAAAMLLSASIKHRGSLVMQISAGGPIRSLVAQATHQRTLRGLARWEREPTGNTLRSLFGEGQVLITVDSEKGERYQGIIPLQGDNLAQALEGYFGQSEQLPTRLWLAADRNHAAGLLLQQLPGSDADSDAWNRLGLLSDTLEDEELLQLPAEQLLTRLFHEETLRLFDAEPCAFRCGCSRERIEQTLAAMGEAETRQIMEEQGEIRVDCEFCNRNYRFDAVDLETLFSPTVSTGAPRQPQ